MSHPKGDGDMDIHPFLTQIVISEFDKTIINHFNYKQYNYKYMIIKIHNPSSNTQLLYRKINKDPIKSYILVNFSTFNLVFPLHPTIIFIFPILTMGSPKA